MKNWFAFSYRIHPDSTIRLLGQTNLNQFSCSCLHQFGQLTLKVRFPYQGAHHSHFRDSFLRIPIRQLDCGNPLINLNLQKSLNARQHPDIIIEFLEAMWNEPDEPWEYEGVVEVKACTRVSINGHSNDYWLEITAKRNSPSEYWLNGAKTIRMTDFGVEPPSAMMGLIKVDDEIGILLNLKILLSNT